MCTSPAAGSPYFSGSVPRESPLLLAPSAIEVEFGEILMANFAPVTQRDDSG